MPFLVRYDAVQIRRAKEVSNLVYVYCETAKQAVIELGHRKAMGYSTQIFRETSELDVFNEADREK